MPAAEREAQIAKWTDSMRAHWRAENGELVNDGEGAYATTEKDYGDFELLVEYRTVPKADSGIYLRGVPQVQIWDYTKNPVGSGAFYNNQKNPKDPLVCADKPIGEWNTYEITARGKEISLWVNGAVTSVFAQCEVPRGHVGFEAEGVVLRTRIEGRTAWSFIWSRAWPAQTSFSRR